MDQYETLVLPATYFAPASFYSAIINSRKILFDGHENFVKQTIRNRCEIFGANGRQILSVPIERRGNHVHANEVKISYKEDWQKIHWRSLISAYRNSSYFEFYVDEFDPFFNKKTVFLFDLNMALHQLLVKLLKLEVEYKFTEDYLADYGTNSFDLRNEKSKLPPIAKYYQVFEERHGFIPNLSILDLLFNAGPDTNQILSSK